MPPKEYLWNVRYKSLYNSSTGMDKYTIDHGFLEGYIVTNGGSLEDVQEQLDKSCNMGEVKNLQTAKFLGYLI